MDIRRILTFALLWLPMAVVAQALVLKGMRGEAVSIWGTDCESAGLGGDHY